MSIPVSFPGLGLELDLSRVAFTIGGFNIYWYGLVIGLGMLLALAMAFSQSVRFGIDPDRMIDVVIIGFICGIVGARLYYVLFSTETYETFFDLINLRGGGLAIYGGVIGAFLGALVGCNLRKVPVAPMLDLTAMGFLIGQAFGRWGNFFNQEAFGTNTTLPWGMISPTTTAYLSQPEVKELLARAGATVSPDLPVHPTFLYESLWCALGFVLLFLYRKKRHFNGEIALFYVMWYGLERAVVEGLRTDPLMLGTLRVSQVLAILSVLAALIIWVIARGRTRGIPLRVPVIPPRTARVHLATAEGKRAVTVAWPYNMKTPEKPERQKLAQAALEALGEDKPDGPLTVLVNAEAVKLADKAIEADAAAEAAEEVGKEAEEALEEMQGAKKTVHQELVASLRAQNAPADETAAEDKDAAPEEDVPKATGKPKKTQAAKAETEAEEAGEAAETDKAAGADDAAKAGEAPAPKKPAQKKAPAKKAPDKKAAAPGQDAKAPAEPEKPAPAKKAAPKKAAAAKPAAKAAPPATEAAKADTDTAPETDGDEPAGRA